MRRDEYRDLVKRHEQTIHAQEYSDLVSKGDSQTITVRTGTRGTRKRTPPLPVQAQSPSQDIATSETDLLDLAGQDHHQQGPGLVGLSPAPDSQGSERSSRATDSSLSNASSPTSLPSTDSAKGLLPTSVGLRRPYNLISGHGGTEFDYSESQNLSVMSMANLESINVNVDDEVRGSALMDVGSAQAAHLPAAPCDAQAQQPEVNSQMMPASACDSRQSLGGQTAPSADPSMFMQSLLFGDCNLDPMSNLMSYGQVLHIPNMNDLDWHSGMASLPELHNEYPRFETTEDIVPTIGRGDGAEAAAESRQAPTWLPRIAQEGSVQRHRVVLDSNYFQSLILDVHTQMGGSLHAFPVKTSREMQHFINGYVDCFHRHFPILHLPSLVPAETPAPLICAMCCTGALYRLERVKGRRLYQVAMQMLDAQINSWDVSARSNSISNGSDRSRDDMHSKDVTMLPLWMLQTRVLLSFYASLGEDENNAIAEIRNLGIFSKVTGIAKYLLNLICANGSCRSTECAVTTFVVLKSTGTKIGRNGSRKNPSRDFYAGSSYTATCL